MSGTTGTGLGPTTGKFEAPGTAGFSIRAAGPQDAEILVTLVRELAVHEKLEECMEATPDQFRQHLFGARPVAEAALAEVAGEPAGFALWFSIFSTFRGTPGLYLEDLFVRTSHRGRGIGKALLAAVARRAVEQGCGWLGWSVLDWNAPAIGFYRALGAAPLEGATVYRLQDEPFRRLAGWQSGNGSDSIRQ